jgi:hypothetical protein
VVLASPCLSHAAIITIDKVAVPDEVQATRVILDNLTPPQKTFIDRLTVDVPTVTLAPGDTVNVHFTLAAPYRFVLDGGINSLTLGIGMLANLHDAPARVPHVSPAAALTILDPDNLRQFSGQASLSYSVDSATGNVASLSAGEGHDYTGPASVTPDRPASIRGFDASFLIPADFPITTFDDGVSLVVAAGVIAVDPPSPSALVGTVPEPASVLLLLCATLLPARRKRVTDRLT